jgi:hypothetical protein
MGPCPIQLRDIMAWLDLVGVVDREAREDAVRLIKAMDDVVMERAAEEHAGNASSKS